MSVEMARTPSPFGAARLGKLGMRIEPGTSFEEWVRIGRHLAHFSNSFAWALGDWLFYGEYEYGKRHHEGVTLTGLDYQTLANKAWVAGKFDFSRRRENLSISHHIEVAALGAAEQDRFLDLAEKGSWSRNELRDALRQAAGRGSSVVQPRLSIAIGADKRERWAAAADVRGLPLIEAAEIALDEWADRVLAA